ncbi:hypothetical protein [Streptomonospora litoralis]|uniref:hypothetical protein n=1 Tax=Streptomonospora litoralis TaxID=2498135 RepID=UPI0010359C20|nr:hypothetical protein [Streptomonospora litoralis]
MSAAIAARLRWARAAASTRPAVPETAPAVPTGRAEETDAPALRIPAQRAPVPPAGQQPPPPPAAASRLSALRGTWRSAALWTLRLTVLVQVGVLLLQSATVGATPAGQAAAAGALGDPLLWPVAAAGTAQAAAAAAIAVGARASWWPAVFSAVLLVGGLVQRGMSGADPAYLILLGTVLVAPGLWVALWAWGWHWPEQEE